MWGSQNESFQVAGEVSARQRLIHEPDNEVHGLGRWLRWV